MRPVGCEHWQGGGAWRSRMVKGLARKATLSGKDPPWVGMAPTRSTNLRPRVYGRVEDDAGGARAAVPAPSGQQPGSSAART
jgi:hypothetical protein